MPFNPNICTECLRPKEDALFFICDSCFTILVDRLHHIEKVKAGYAEASKLPPAQPVGTKLSQPSFNFTTKP